MIYIIVGLLMIWTLFSVRWFVTNLGIKSKQDTWVDLVLSPPVLVLAGIIGIIGYIFDKVRGER